MNANFKFDGVTYAAHPLSVGEQLDIEWLNSEFVQHNEGISKRKFNRVVSYTPLLIGVEVIEGDPPAFMVSPDATIEELEAGLTEWLKAPKQLKELAEKAIAEAELAGNPPELSGNRPNT